MRVFALLLTFMAFAIAANAAGAKDFSASPVLPSRTTDNVPGPDAISMLTRRQSSLYARVNTSNLDPQSPYTLWAVIFNRPEFCQTSPCGEADLPVSPGHDPRVEATILFAGGGVADANGGGDFIGRVFVDSNGVVTGDRLMGIGVLDTQRAEVHIVLRSHGYPIGEEIFTAISSFAGGCNASNPCEDQQFAIHAGKSAR
jgi:hypothetical protein